MTGTTVRALRPDELDAWDRVVGPAGGRVYQTTWWAAPLAPFGVRFHVLGRFDDGVLVGGVLVRALSVPRLPIAVLDAIRGPIGPGWTPASIAQLVDALDEVVRRERAIQVSVLAVPDAAVHAMLLAELGRRRGQVRTRPDAGEAILDLAGRSVEEVLAGFAKTHRRSLRVAAASRIEVRELRSDEDLDAAYDCLATSAARQGYVELRPASALLPLLRRGVATGEVATIGAVVDGEVIAAAVVVLVGPTAEYLYAGYRTELVDGAKAFPSLAVQRAAIERASAEGFASYSLGLLGGSSASAGVDAFKLRHGARELPALDTITWVVRPTVVRTVDAVRASSWGKAAIRRVRRLVLDRGAVADGA